MKKFAFYNFPRETRPAAYDEALESVKLQYSALPDLLSIYSFGSVSAPGISDLDIILVLRNNSRRRFPLRLRTVYLGNLEKRHRYVVYHNFFVCSENIMHNFRYIYPFADVKRIYGKDIAMEGLGSDTKRTAARILLMDLIAENFPREFVEVLKSDKIDVRNALLRLNSLGIDIRNFKTLFGKAPKSEWQGYEQQVSGLRRNWFKNGVGENKNKLLQLIRIAPRISLELIESADDYVVSRGFVGVEKGKGPNIFNSHRYHTIFQPDWKRDAALQGMMSGQKNTVSILPLSMSAPLQEYAKASGPLSNHIRKHLKIKTKCGLLPNEVALKRIELLNEQARLAEDTQHLHFPAFINYGYVPTNSLLSKAAYLAKRFRIHKSLKGI